MLLLHRHHHSRQGLQAQAHLHHRLEGSAACCNDACCEAKKVEQWLSPTGDHNAASNRHQREVCQCSLTHACGRHRHTACKVGNQTFLQRVNRALLQSTGQPCLTQVVVLLGQEPFGCSSKAFAAARPCKCSSSDTGLVLTL